MPGKTSLKRHQYYAHSRNLFWQFLFSFAGKEYTPDYDERLELLDSMNIALWDVLARCERPGSLDVDILNCSEKANDIVGLLKEYPRIHKICFNGKKAFTCFKKHILKKYPEIKDLYELHNLPSTSPANAAIDYQTRFVCWKNALFEEKLPEIHSVKNTVPGEVLQQSL
jgi:TDG/mug DNA glycosylase family protein